MVSVLPQPPPPHQVESLESPGEEDSMLLTDKQKQRPHLEMVELIWWIVPNKLFSEKP
jgi:hypothetical protein